MRISYNCPPSNLKTNHGYGKAGYGMVQALNRLGHSVFWKDDEAELEIAFCQPDLHAWSNDNAYHIQYTPWESSQLPEGWVEAFNTNCDEVWTTSETCKKWFIDAGVTKAVHVYHHGAEPSIWTPKLRKRGKVLKFLHVGSPAPRKGAQQALDAFRDVFGDRDDVHLTIKAFKRTEARARISKDEIDNPAVLNNVDVIYDDYSEEDMVKLAHEHDVLIYNSYSEGFGLIPLEHMFTGMPVVCPKGWAPYKDFIIDDLAPKTTIGPCPHPEINKGDVFNIDYISLCETLTNIDKNYKKYAQIAYDRVTEVTKAFDWDTLTQRAFAESISRIENAN